jgi:integrase
MQQGIIVEISRYREKKKRRKRHRLNVGRKGRIYGRSGKLWVDFHYLGERVREPSGLDDNQSNRDRLRKQLDLVMAEIENSVFEFAKRFPQSNRKDHFNLIETKTVRKNPEDIVFGDYAKRWWKEMEPGMSQNQIRDYSGILKNHLHPFFGNLPFSEFKPVVMKKFIAQLKGRQNRYGQPLSGKSIRNYLIPLRVIVRDAMDEFGWDDLRNPFWGMKLPKVRRLRVQPFNYEEWLLLLEQMLPWYRPYFEFAVQTGLRPSEQVALKWTAIDDTFIHIELSRVRKLEKAELKTQESVRRIELRANMRATLARQRELSSRFQKPYVFVNSEGRPIQQENLGKIWRQALSKSGVRYRRLYETRHTFASWALAAGESPEWVARTLGHVDTTMVYRTYGCYIPHLTRQDGSAFERQYAEALRAEALRAEATKKGSPNRHNFRHNDQNLGSFCDVSR